MRIKKRRLIAGLVVAAAAFAACVANEAKTSSTEQGLHFEVNGMGYSGSASVACGSATVNGAPVNCPPLTIVADSGDNLLLTAIDDSACGSTIIDADDSGLPVAITCQGGAGTGTTDVIGSNFGCIPTSYVLNARYLATGPGVAGCTVVARFENPSVPGSSTPYSIHYSGYGNAPTSGITVSPTDIDFGQVSSGAASNPIQVVVKNIGSGPVTVNAATASPYSTSYTGGTGSGSGSGTFASLGASATATFNVVCTSPMNASNDGTLTFTPSAGTAQTVALHCAYVDSLLTVDPSPVSFSPTIVYASQQEQVVTISSSTSDTVTGVHLSVGHSDDLTLIGGFSGGMTPVGSGSGVQVTLRYTPTVEHTSGSLGQLRIDSMGGIGTSRLVEISGIALNAKVAAAPNAIEFGPVCAGTTKTEDFEVYAEAAGGFTLDALDQPDAPFAVTGPALAPPMSLAGNHANSAMFTATLTAGATLGERSSTMTLHTSLPSQLNPTLAVPLHATVLAAGVSPTPGDVDFGANPVDTPTFARMVTITNCGDATKITAVRITGVDAGEFAVIDPADPLVEVEQFGKLDLRLVMFPKTPGAKVAQLEVDYEGGTEPVIVTLDGTAFGANTGSDGDVGTYYTCSAGGAAGALPVGLALLLVRRRRRKA